jgi:hypothetical protein
MTIPIRRQDSARHVGQCSDGISAARLEQFQHQIVPSASSLCFRAIEYAISVM